MKLYTYTLVLKKSCWILTLTTSITPMVEVESKEKYNIFFYFNFYINIYIKNPVKMSEIKIFIIIYIFLSILYFVKSLNKKRNLNMKLFRIVKNYIKVSIFYIQNKISFTRHQINTFSIHNEKKLNKMAEKITRQLDSFSRKDDIMNELEYNCINYNKKNMLGVNLFVLPDVILKRISTNYYEFLLERVTVEKKELSFNTSLDPKEYIQKFIE